MQQQQQQQRHEIGKIRGSATAERDKEIKGRRRGGGGSVEAGGKWHVAGLREGEIREEVANLDPGMNDPLPLGARGKPLSSPFTPFCDPRAPLPPSISADAATTPPGSVPLSLPFHFLFAGLTTTHSYLRSSPFDHRHPHAASSFSSSSSSHSKQHPSLSSSRRSSSLPRFHSRSTLALRVNLSRGG